jgi:hypothetical protein
LAGDGGSPIRTIATSEACSTPRCASNTSPPPRQTLFLAANPCNQMRILSRLPCQLINIQVYRPFCPEVRHSVSRVQLCVEQCQPAMWLMHARLNALDLAKMQASIKSATLRHMCLQLAHLSSQLNLLGCVGVADNH